MESERLWEYVLLGRIVHLLRFEGLGFICARKDLSSTISMPGEINS